MAYTTKSGQVIPCQFDLLVMPLLEGFRAVADPAAVAELRERVKATAVPTETDEFAHLRLRGTHARLGLFADYMRGPGGACPEFVDLLERLRDGIARRHDALPTNPEFPRARLGRAAGEAAPWVAAALAQQAAGQPPDHEKTPVRNDNAAEAAAAYSDLLEF